MKKIILAVTGASGAVYFQRILHLLSEKNVQFHIIISKSAKIVINEELDQDIHFPKNSIVYKNSDIAADLASGSNIYDAMCILPCSMGTVGKIANGIADNLITRSADVMLKEKRKLIICARETPMNLIHLRNLTTLSEAGAYIMPACVSFYNNPETLLDIVDSYVHRIMDVLGESSEHTLRWKKNKSETKSRTQISDIKKL